MTSVDIIAKLEELYPKVENTNLEGKLIYPPELSEALESISLNELLKYPTINFDMAYFFSPIDSQHMSVDINCARKTLKYLKGQIGKSELYKVAYVLLYIYISVRTNWKQGYNRSLPNKIRLILAFISEPVDKKASINANLV